MNQTYFKRIQLSIVLVFFITLSTSLGYAQKKNVKNKTTSNFVSDSIFNALKWRNIGPFRSGRSLAVAGHANHPLTYYFGSTGGGVWKTIDGGNEWFPISDSIFKSSAVGAITVAPSDANVVYVGMGEADMRSNISFGDGMYKSVNGGKTWSKSGLDKADAIANIEVHPSDANIVFVAAMGNPFKSNPERGVYRSQDGGKTWQLVLSKDEKTGAMCVRIDPTNPRIVYATLWEGYRNGHSMSSGGKGSGMYKSIDGGDTWKSLNEKPGMPVGILGKMGIAVSPVNSNRLYALIENTKGGLYRSNDAGEHWELINEDKNLWQRPWYYMNLQTDPKNENGLIVLNVDAWKTSDGGKSFKKINVRHGDTHDVWINPLNPDNFIIGDDGGGEVTFNGGETFTELDTPTAQFYHVSVDNEFPYNIYGAQQDNSSIRIASRTSGNSIGPESWYAAAGGEAGYIEADPTNADITYGGEYDGQLSSYNKKTGQRKDISPYPESNIGAPSNAKKYRFQWTYPIVFSPHNPKRMYVTSQVVHVTEDQGHSFEIISPDLSRNDPKTTGETGGPITKDQTGAEVYATIFTLSESPLEKGVIWTGSDDGLVHITKNNGANWENISLPTTVLPDFSLISMIHTSEHEKGKAYLTANKYMYGDRTPYMFKTVDYGKSWTKITNGIPSDEYCRVLREDPNKPGLLFAGTERGVYVSFNDGDSWQKLNLNLPVTPIRDLRIQKREKDLIVATHGRSFWVLDDITPLYEIKDKTVKGDKHLFKPRPAYRMQGGQSDDMSSGTNAPNGVIVRYFFKKKPSSEIKLQFLTPKGDTINTYSSTKDMKGEPMKISKEFYQDPKKEQAGFITAKAGMNSFVWNMRYPNATAVDGTNVMWAGSGIGAKVVPGSYIVRLIEDKTIIAEAAVEIKLDPRMTTSDADLKEQFDLHQKVNKKVNEAHLAINQLRKIRTQINGYIATVKDTVAVNQMKKMTKSTLENLDKIESSLMQPKAKAPQDVLAFPIQLNDKMAGLGSNISSSESKPTRNAYVVYEDLAMKIDAELQKIKDIVDNDVKKFNAFVMKQQIPAIILDKEIK
ncbi:glycosyl hydrolase [Flavobacterium sp. RSP49]|uniref:WD40/YVTN/BNR-like repeat-containing protein n=1 Tax=Flavobacterium sp. RSP49 TaxID=2497487 RepID=UPI000F841906|nr:glycosyl hydrolase [Flavobacterium sp. RSP49]RTZ02156.1 glycosyl hydrolase [Flavobacterium sp. RSP49]